MIYRSASTSVVISRSPLPSFAREMAEHERRRQAPDAIPVIQLADVDLSYGAVQILFDVSFEVHRGEVLALLGTNGAGKSTVLKVITGLVTPERGVVRLNGRDHHVHVA